MRAKPALEGLLMALYCISFRVMERGDPSFPEDDYPTAVIDGLSLGDTPEEAWEAMKVYCWEKLRVNYNNNPGKCKFVSKMMAQYKSTRGKSVLPALLKWVPPVIVIVEEQYVKVTEVSSDKGDYIVKVPRT